MNRKQLVAKLDRVFSQFVRLSHADEGGTVECVTCGKLLWWKEAHAGHYISRRHMNTRFDVRNVHPQCCGCNTFRNGQPDEYALYLREKYGDEILEQLNERKHQVKKFTSEELTHLIKHFQERVGEYAAAREA
jgi:hypothetical protein